MLLCMRTTIAIDDELFRTFKMRAAQRGTTLSAEIEEALRAEALREEERARGMPPEPFVMPISRSEIHPGVDITSNASIIEALGGDGGWPLDAEGHKVGP